MMILAVQWGNATLVAVISFALVFVVLVLLIGVIKIFGMTFARKSVSAHDTVPTPAVAAEGPDEEEVVAIAMALHLFYNHHDEESDVLTFRQDGQGITPWTIQAISKQLK